MDTIGSLLAGSADPAVLHDRLTSGLADREVAPRLGITNVGVPATKVSGDLAWLLENQPLGNLAIKAWASWEAVEKAKKASRAEPALTHGPVHIGTHKVVAKLSPTVEITVEGVKVRVVTIDLAVNLEVASVALLAKHGSIVEARVGSAKATAKMSISGKTIIERDVVEVDLGPIVSF